MKIINCICPCCSNQIKISLDDKGNVISVEHNLKQATKEQLQSKNIEFGVMNNLLKEGETI